MSDHATPPQTATPAQIRAVFRAVSRELGIGRHFIQGPSRLPAIVFARAVAILVLRERLRMSWPQIGAAVVCEQSSAYELASTYRSDPEVAREVRRVSESLDAQISPPGAGGSAGHAA